jgi:transposase
VDVIVERCAGLDVHRDNVVATVRVPGTGRRRFDQQTRTFKSTLAGLAELAGWLADAGVTLVGMEATGVYWKTVFQALEDRFECWLLNAHHLRNVPGRKTDVKDSEWICQLVQHGLVRPSFVPPPEIRRLRDLTRLRKAQSKRAWAHNPAPGEGAPGRRDQARKRRVDDLLEVRPRDARSTSVRGHRSRAARGAIDGQDA